MALPLGELSPKVTERAMQALRRFGEMCIRDRAKAAQWCVEQGLLDAREGKFESDGWMPKFKTIEIWNKAFPKK